MDLRRTPMRNASRDTRRSEWSELLSQSLRRAAAPDSGDRPDPELSSREAAAIAAARLAFHVDTFWKSEAVQEPAPIDVVDMFSGCGGMSAGFRLANGMANAYRLIAAFDTDAVANRSYLANLGTTPFAEDVGRLASEPARLSKLLKSVGRDPSRPLVLIGCAPCQGFSSHRNDAGSADPRNSLFVDFTRIAAHLRPDAIISENVPELLTTRYWSLVEAGLKNLEDAGYFVHIGVHNLAEFGVPQERFRTLVLAMRRPFAPIRGLLKRSEFRTVRDAIGGLSPVAAGDRDPHDPMHYSAGHRQSTIDVIKAVPRDGGDRPEHIGPECLRRAKEKSGRAVYEDVYGRLYWDRPAITVTAYARNPASGRYTHPEQDRGLTVREAALLQGFPRDYWFEGSLDERFRQIGNAVPPIFGAVVAMHVLGELTSPARGTPTFEPGFRAAVGPSFSRLIPALKAGHLDGKAMRALTA